MTSTQCSTMTTKPSDSTSESLDHDCDSELLVLKLISSLTFSWVSHRMQEWSPRVYWRTRATSAALPPLILRPCWSRYIFNCSVNVKDSSSISSFQEIYGRVFLSLPLKFRAFIATNERFWRKLLPVPSSTTSTLRCWHTFCTSFVLEDVNFPKFIIFLTCTPGRSWSWSLLLLVIISVDETCLFGGAVLSLIAGTGNHFTGTPSVHPSCFIVCMAHRKCSRLTLESKKSR